jgi:hypothetical protein
MKQDIGALLQTRRFDFSMEPPPEQVIFRIDFQTIGSLGDYALLTGRPKAGKTKYLAGAMAASLSRLETFGMNIRLPDDKRRVVHFDTEQGKRSHFNLLKLVAQLTGKETIPPYFDSYHCRQDNAAQIIAMIDYYLDHNSDTGALFLDGLLDLIESFNDEKHSKYLVNWLKQITEKHNVFILGILHRSMSADKSIGHLGSSADRAAQSVLIVEKNKDTKQYLLKPEYLRDGDDFVPIAIHYNKGLNLWERTDFIDEMAPAAVKSLKRKPYEYTIEDHRPNVWQIFNSTALQSYDLLLQNIKEVYGVGRNWAVDCIKELVKHNLVFKIEGGYTNVQQGRLSLIK